MISDNPSHFESIQYPSELEIRVICLADFDCQKFLQDKGILVTTQSTATSRNKKFITYRFQSVYQSYQEYISIRECLLSHPQVQIIL